MKPPMTFEAMGLPKSESIEKAYDYALKIHVQRFDEELKIAHRSVDEQMKHQFEQMKLSGKYTPDQLEDLKKQQEIQTRAIKRQVEQQMLETRDSDFITRNIEPARILGESDAKNEDTINAILLLETIRSPKDYEKIKKKFGSGVSNIIADVLDFEAYPSEQETKLKTLSDDSKLANLALLVGSMKSFVEIGKTLPPGQKMMLAGGKDSSESKINFASAVRGLNEKLDDMFVDSFNELTKYIDMGFKVEVDKETNTLKAVPIKNPPPTGPRGNSGPNIGGDFFGNDDDTPPSGSFGGPRSGGPKIGGGF